MENYGYAPTAYNVASAGGGGYMYAPYAPAANIERTLYGTTVVRVADDRPSRPQMMMPFINQYHNNQHVNTNAFKFHTVRATRLGTPVAITIEPPPTYIQSQQDETAYQQTPIERGTWSHAPVQYPASTWVQQPPQTTTHHTSLSEFQQQQPQLQQAPMQQLYPPQPTMYQTTQNTYGISADVTSSYDQQNAKSPIETYAPRSFAVEDTDPSPTIIRQKKKRERKHREKVIVTAQVRKDAEMPAKHRKKKHRHHKRKKKRRDDSSTSGSSTSSSSDTSSSSSSSSESDDENDERRKSRRKKHKKKRSKRATDVEAPAATGPKMVKKKAPIVKHYLEYSIVSAIFNLLFGTVAIVLSVSSIRSKRARKFRQARWEGAFAAIIATLGLIVSAVIIVIILLYLYTNSICDDCSD